MNVRCLSNAYYVRKKVFNIKTYKGLEKLLLFLPNKNQGIDFLQVFIQLENKDAGKFNKCKSGSGYIIIKKVGKE
jgi:hypothetical protein